MRATFPSAARLLRPSDYAAALKGKRIAKGALFVVSTPKPDPALPPKQPRLGLIVAKRFAPHAVTRNTIKRVIREAFRLRQYQIAPRDYVFRLHSSVGSLTLTQLKSIVRTEVDALLDRTMP